MAYAFQERRHLFFLTESIQPCYLHLFPSAATSHRGNETLLKLILQQKKHSCVTGEFLPELAFASSRCSCMLPNPYSHSCGSDLVKTFPLTSVPSLQAWMKTRWLDEELLNTSSLMLKNHCGFGHGWIKGWFWIPAVTQDKCACILYVIYVLIRHFFSLASLRLELSSPEKSQMLPQFLCKIRLFQLLNLMCTHRNWHSKAYKLQES